MTSETNREVLFSRGHINASFRPHCLTRWAVWTNSLTWNKAYFYAPNGPSWWMSLWAIVRSNRVKRVSKFGREGDLTKKWLWRILWAFLIYPKGYHCSLSHLTQVLSLIGLPVPLSEASLTAQVGKCRSTGPSILKDMIMSVTPQVTVCSASLDCHRWNPPWKFLARHIKIYLLNHEGWFLLKA